MTCSANPPPCSNPYLDPCKNTYKETYCTNDIWGNTNCRTQYYGSPRTYSTNYCGPSLGNLFFSGYPRSSSYSPYSYSTYNTGYCAPSYSYSSGPGFGSILGILAFSGLASMFTGGRW